MAKSRKSSGAASNAASARGRTAGGPPASRRAKLWTVVVFALLIGGIFAYVRLKPELAEARAAAAEAAKSPKAQVRDNLVALGALADDYFAKHPDAKSVVVKDLIQSTPGAALPASVLGENYETVTIARDWTFLKISLPDGGELIVPKP